jgi:flagellar biosynthesis/type III secretory pathway chaperone
LSKKQKVLEEIYAVTKKQEQLLKETAEQTEELDKCMDQKSDCLEKLNQLDDGFDVLYRKVKKELQESPGKFQKEIEELKKLVHDIMELSVSIQALEQKNKLAMERYFMRHRKNIQIYKSSRRRIDTYYNTMTGFNPHQSYFMDKKK